MRKLIYLFGFLVLIFALLLGLPSFLSSKTGRSWLLSIVNSRIDGTLEAEQLSIGWLSGQRIEGLKLSDATGEAVFATAAIESEASLLALLRGAASLGRTHIQSPYLRLEQDREGRSNLDRILRREPQVNHASSTGGTGQDTGPMQLHVPFVGELTLSDGRLELVQAGLDPIAVRDIEMLLAMPEPSGPLSARITAQSQQAGRTGELRFEASMRGFDRSGRFEVQTDDSGALRLGEGTQIVMKADVLKLPVAMFDGLFATDLASIALGDTLDLRINNEVNGPNWNLDLDVNSPSLAANFVGATSGPSFSLTQAAELRFTLEPRLLQAIMEAADIPDAPELLAPVDISASIGRFIVPLQQNSFVLSDASLQWALAVGPATLRLPSSGEEQRIDALNAELDSAGLGKAVRIQASGRGGGSTLLVDGNFSDLMQNGKRTLNQAGADLKIEVQSFPIALCDRLLGFEGLLEASVGQRLDGRVEVSGQAGKLQAVASAQSSQLRLERLALEWDDVVRLSSPASLQATLSPKLVRSLDPETSLLRPVVVQAELKALQLPYDLDRPLRFQPEETTLQAVLRANDIDVTRAEGEQLSIERVLVELDGEHLEGGSLSLQARVDSRSLPASLGLPADIDMTGKLTFGSVGLNDLACAISSANSRLKLSGRLRTDQVLEISEPVALRHRLTPRDFPRLRETAELLASIDPFTLPLSDLALSQLQLQGAGQLDALVVEGGSIQDASLRWQLDFPASRASVDMTATASSAAQTGRSPLEAQVLASGWWKDGVVDMKSAQVTTNAKLEALPIAIIEALSGLDGLVALIGESAEVNVESRLSQLNPPVGQADFNAQGAGFSMSSALDVDGKRLSTRDGSTRLNWTLTPERFKRLSSSGVSLQRDAEVEVQVRQLAFPTEWNASQAPLRTVSLDLNGSIRRLDARDDASGQAVRIDQLALSASTQNMTDDLNFTLDGQGQGQSGSIGIDVEGRLGQLLTDGGDWNYGGSKLFVDAKLSNVPPALLGGLAGVGNDYNEALAALFGQRLDSQIRVDLQGGAGPVTTELDSENSDARFRGRLQNGVLRLDEPATATLRVTEELSRTVLKNVNPLLVTAVSAEERIRVRIETQGFSVQMLPFDLSRASFERGIVELGKIRMRKGGVLGLFLGLTSLPGVGREPEVNAWFTPQYMNLSNGVATLERMDALIADQFHLATWGKVDINRDRVDMTSGIGGATLRRNFRVRNVEDDFLMQTRITGTTSNASIPTGRILAQIATMTGGGGGLGGILGNVIIGGAAGQAPQPTTQPFPWADFFPPPRSEEEQAQEQAQDNQNPQQQEPQQEEERRRPTLFDILRPN